VAFALDIARPAATLLAAAAALAGCSGAELAPGPSGGEAAAAAVGGPTSLEAFLAAESLVGAPVAAFEAATRRIAGARVAWPLRSWGGEESSVGFDTPAGRRRGVDRVRLVSESLQGANLGGVISAGHPVVVCLARPSGGAAAFERADGRREPAPAAGATVTVEGLVWGVTDEGGTPHLWLRDCAVVP
jgi:hypothetical protein